ncbi:MAG: CcmD family protein [Bacteroidota bacterium]
MFHWSAILLQSKLPEPAILFSNEKVYTVMAVLLVIFGAMVAYLFSTNKKMKQLEEKLSELQDQQSP